MIAAHFMISGLVLAGLFILIFTKNIVHGAYAFALTAVGVAGIYIVLHAEVLAVVQLLLYAGGVVILLSFGIMLTHRSRGESPKTPTGHEWLAALLAMGFFIGTSYVLAVFDFSSHTAKPRLDAMKEMGFLFLTEHLVAFELIAFILLVALVGAAYLSKHATHE